MTALLAACLIQHFLKEKVAKDKRQLCRMFLLGYRQNTVAVLPPEEESVNVKSWVMCGNDKNKKGSHMMKTLPLSNVGIRRKV